MRGFLIASVMTSTAALVILASVTLLGYTHMRRRVGKGCLSTWSVAVTTLVLVTAPAAAVETASFQGLGIGSQATAMSGDGSTIVGATQSAQGPEAFRW